MRREKTKITTVVALATLFTMLLSCAADPCDDLVTPRTCDESDAEGLSGQDATDLCNLVDVVTGASVEAETQDQVVSCLPDQGVDAGAELLTTLCDMSDSDRADELEEMTESGGVCADSP